MRLPRLACHEYPSTQRQYYPVPGLPELRPQGSHKRANRLKSGLSSSLFSFPCQKKKVSCYLYIVPFSDFLPLVSRFKTIVYGEKNRPPWLNLNRENGCWRFILDRENCDLVVHFEPRTLIFTQITPVPSSLVSVPVPLWFCGNSIAVFDMVLRSEKDFLLYVAINFYFSNFSVVQS